MGELTKNIALAGALVGATAGGAEAKEADVVAEQELSKIVMPATEDLLSNTEIVASPGDNIERLQSEGISRDDADNSLGEMFGTSRAIKSVPNEQFLLERVKQGDPSVTAVLMNQGETVTIEPGEPFDVFTFGLGGCQACAVVSIDEQERVAVTITHYDPGSLIANGDRLKQLLQTHKESLGESAQHTLLISSPGEYVQRSESSKVAPMDSSQGKWVLEPKDGNIATYLGLICKIELGEGIEQQVLPYSEGRRFGQSTALIISRHSEGTPIRYEICDTHFGSIERKE